MKSLAVIGSRTLPLEWEEAVLGWLDEHLELAIITTIVSGGAKGADTLAEILARRLNKELQVYTPDYTRYQRKAGVIRNGEIARHAEGCLALIDKPLETSRGTFDCVKKFRKQKKPVWVLFLDAESQSIELLA